MTPLVREEVQEVGDLLRGLEPLTDQELRELVAAFTRVAARSPFEVAVLTVRVGDGRPELRVSAGGDGDDECEAEADVPCVVEATMGRAAPSG